MTNGTACVLMLLGFRKFGSRLVHLRCQFCNQDGRNVSPHRHHVQIVVLDGTQNIVLFTYLVPPQDKRQKRQHGSGPQHQSSNRVGGVRRRQRTTHARLTRDSGDENIDEEENDELVDIIGDYRNESRPKIGVKKQRKLDMKAEKRSNAESERQEREERRERSEKLDQKRKEEQARSEELEKQQQEEARLLEKEKARTEHELYLKLREEFDVEDEGCEESEDDETAQNKLSNFISYIQDNKVVLMEDVASHFGMRTQDTIDRVKALMESEQLSGLMDDRGKFIHVSQEELNSVATFIKQRGRISLSDLVENSNRLINLQPIT